MDVALSVTPTVGVKRKIKQEVLNVASKLGLELMNPSEVRSRRTINRYVFDYESLFQETPVEIIVETSFSHRSYPYDKLRISGYVEKYLERNHTPLPVPIECLSFDMDTQSLERTFIDKLFAIYDTISETKSKDCQDTFTT